MVLHHACVEVMAAVAGVVDGIAHGSRNRDGDFCVRVRIDVGNVVISPKLSAVRHADEIIVLENGHIAERGTHEELLALHGLYYQTWQAQFGMMPDQKEVTDYGC